MPISNAAHHESLKKSVLLADDESALTLLLEIELTRRGYQVVTAYNGSEAARIGSDMNQPIDVLITDWKMPGMTGDVLARQLMEGRPTLVVILMSGYDEVEEIVKTFDPARVRFLRKPFNPALLDQTIRILLGLPLHSNSLVA
jgi:two-component system, cell cycle sensor histidine kinase and response regulator CckA